MLFDLGVSSMQLDVRERGFAYAEDAPLDMRMDDTDRPDRRRRAQRRTPPRSWPGSSRGYGEEKFARRIADAIVRERETEPFTRSGRLVELLYDAIPAPARRTGGHPAKRTFQALRIEVNDELAVLRRAIPAAIDAIGVGGRVVVMSYHSLEDRITKQAFATATRSDAPAGPAVRARGARAGAPAGDPGGREGHRRTRSMQNPRAASVRLRAVERVRAGAVA